MASESDNEVNDTNGSGDAGEKVVAPLASTVNQPSRRRAMLRTLGAAGPVVMTLVSNPVSACTCVNASAFGSALAMASRKPTSAQPCDGMKPARWAGAGSSWPSPYIGTKRTGQAMTANPPSMRPLTR